MTQKERQQLIKLGILTKDCDPSVTSGKLSPELKREARRRVKERESMTGLLVTTILERLKQRINALEREEQSDRKGKTIMEGGWEYGS